MANGHSGAHAQRHVLTLVYQESDSVNVAVGSQN